jgi:hypothetical protein
LKKELTSTNGGNFASFGLNKSLRFMLFELSSSSSKATKTVHAKAAAIGYEPASIPEAFMMSISILIKSLSFSFPSVPIKPIALPSPP